MWDGRSIAVILPTYREKATIRATIEGFAALGIVDDILVVNNNAEPGTSEEVAGTAAREVVETLQGYGAAIRRGIRETDADLVCVCEPDGTFDPRDLWKLVAYAADFEFVFGSRTVKEFIWDGANMGHFLRWGNWAVAKEMELLFNTTSTSFHGHPDPLQCPAERSRKSIALYYYSNGRDDGQTARGHHTLWQVLPGEQAPSRFRVAMSLFRRGARMLLPEKLVRT